MVKYAALLTERFTMANGYLNLVTLPYQSYAKSIYRVQGKMVRAFFYSALPYSSPYKRPIQVQHGITAVLKTA